MKPREAFTRFVEAMNSLDFEALERLIHPDYVNDYPQSGERFRGFAAFRAQLEAYPGGIEAGAADLQTSKLVGDDERWVISPGYTVLPLAGPDRFTAVTRTRYPDGSRWWVVAIIEMRDGMIYKGETYFAPEFEPPEWRRGMVEIIPRD